MTYQDSRETSLSIILQYIPDPFRIFIEENFYGEVSRQAVLEYVANDKEFLKNPIKHIALYSDHGIVHVRDVATQIIQVLDRIHGVLINFRSKRRLEFMKGYGTAIAYLHDIGMRDFSSFGRFMHPEFAAQAVFTNEFEPYIELLWEENAGNMAWRLLSLSTRNLLKQKPEIVLKEILALSVCHSKSKVPIDILNDRKALRKLMQRILSTDLHALYLEQRVGKLDKQRRKKIDKEGEQTKTKKVERKYEEALKKWEVFLESGKTIDNQLLDKHYANISSEAFCWLESDEPLVQELVVDVIDTLRALRCADALRQRGTTYRTSAGYEVFVDQKNANAIYALRNQDNSKLFLYEAKKPLNAGEANLASSELDSDCNLRVSFHRGLFSNKKTTRKAAFNAAVAIHDIEADVIQSFQGVRRLLPEDEAKQVKDETDIRILIEGTDDNPDFAKWVCEELQKLDASVGKRSKTVVSLQNADLEEVDRYLRGKEILEHFQKVDVLQKLLEKTADSGHKVDKIDHERAFREVRVISLVDKEQLIQGGSPSGFVYIPLTEGLKVIPLGGYTSVPAQAWVPIGNTGVIRGSVRNAHVIAEVKVDLLVIPRQVYLQYWYHTYNAKQLAGVLEKD